IRYGLRMLAKNPGFTGVAVATLALGIGANTAIFSLVNAVMLQSLPVHHPEQLVVLRWSAHGRPENIGSSSYGDCSATEWRGSNYGGCSFSYPMFKEIQAEKDVFSSVTAFAGPAQLDLSGNGPASMARGELVSGNYFQVLGVPAALGRTLQPADELPGAAPVVVLNYGYWQSAFGGSSGAIRKTIRLNGVSFSVVGVSDPNFTRLTPGKSLDMWLPLTQLIPLGLPWGRGSIDAGNWWLTLVGRMKPGTPLPQAQETVSLLFRNETLHGEKPALIDSDNPKVTLLPAQKALTGIRSMFGVPLYLLMAAVGIVLLIACANVAGLMLARATAREKEMAVRLAMGAGRGRVIQQLLTESVLLSAAGAVLGIFLAYWGAAGLASFLAANSYSPLNIDVQPDATVLVFTIAVALLTGIGFGLAPAFRGTRVNIAPVLKENSGSLSAASHAGGRRFGMGSSLVVAQVALSMVVLIGAGLLLRTLEKLRNINPGFDTRNVLLFSVDPTLAGYKKENIQNVYDELERRLVALPGVISASYSSDALLDGGLWTSGVHVEGQSAKSTVETQMLAAGPDFFETMRIPLVKGRTFRVADMRSKQEVAVVNEAFVHKFLESRDAIGMHFGGTDKDDPQREIVGVVADTKYDDMRKADEPTAYIPLKNGELTFALRSAAAPSALIPAVRRIVNDVDENLPVFGLRTQTQTIDRLLFGQRLVARLSSLFGLLGLLLACIGLYGLLSYEVARRTREIGIRAALGAQRWDVLRMVIKQGLVLVAFGAATGIIASFAVTRFLQSLLFGVHATDPWTFAAVCLLLVFVGVLACYIPARRATRVDPMVALRYE
ncbi:MAG: ABC transporter permease, partial [Candidatus Acidiferrum sp.]